MNTWTAIVVGLFLGLVLGVLKDFIVAAFIMWRRHRR